MSVFFESSTQMYVQMGLKLGLDDISDGAEGLLLFE